MNISIIGAGRIGLVLGVSLADKGHSVSFTDRDFEKLKNLSKGKIPFYEPGLQSLLRKNRSRLKWVKDPQEVISSKVLFLTLSLPVKAGGDFDLSGVKDWTRRIIRDTQQEKILILKSTLPVGTNRTLQNMAKKAEVPLYVVTCPEFLRQGQALRDIQNPHRVVIAGPSSRINKLVARLYRSFSHGPAVFTSPETAEISKLGANSFLALKISFINLMANMAEKFPVDMEDMQNILGLDPRIGRAFLQPGLGFGGSCLPKDLKHLIFQGRRKRVSMKFFREAETLNQLRADHFLQQIKRKNKILLNKTYAFWGLSFKPDTDDVRFSPALLLAQLLLKEGAKLQVFDPLFCEDWLSFFSFPEGKKPTRVTFHNNPLSALKSAQGLVVGTDWKGFRKISLSDIKTRLKDPFIVDGRGLFNAKKLEKQGFMVYQAGVFSPD